MRIKSAVITALIVWLIIAAVSLGIAFYRHDLSARSVIQNLWLVSFGIGALGLLFRGGAATGASVEVSEGVASSSQHREQYLQADAEDARAGIAFGTIVMLSALVVFAASLAILYFFFRV